MTVISHTQISTHLAGSVYLGMQSENKTETPSLTSSKCGRERFRARKVDMLLLRQVVVHSILRRRESYCM